MPSTNRKNFSWWSAFRSFCLLAGLTLIGLAYFAPQQLESYVSTDLAWTLGFILLLILPISMVIRFGAKRFLGSVAKSGQRAAIEKVRGALPDWAAQRGLQFEPSPQHREVGEALGEYRGYRVMYAPDAGDISVRWRQPLASGPLDLSTTPPPARSHDEVAAFDSGDERFDDAFQTRFASEELAEQVGESGEARDALVGFWEAHADVLEEVNVDAHGVVCFLRPESQYDIEVAGALLDAQIDMMDAVEQQLG